MKRWLTATIALTLIAGGTLPAIGQSLDETELRGENIRLREEPADDAFELAVLQGGEAVEVTGEPVLVDGHAWWPVLVVESGDEGWVRWEFLDGASPEADPALPTATVDETPVDETPVVEERPRRAAAAEADVTPDAAAADDAGNADGNGGRQGGGRPQGQDRANRADRSGQDQAADATDEAQAGAGRGGRAQDEADAEPTTAPEPTAEATPTVEPEPSAEATSTAVPASEGTPAPVENDEPVAEGTEENPIALGSTGAVGDWEIRVTQFRRDATDDVLAADAANERPDQGEQYALVEVDLTNVGDRQGDVTDLLFAVVGDAGEAYEAGSCGEVPEALDLEERVPAGEQRSGSLCFVIAEEDASSLVLYVNEPLALDAEPVWFALRDS